jgi:heptosyltransferase-2/heptosyltransferase-3
MATYAPDAHLAPVTVASAHLDAGRAALRAAGWDGRSRVLLVHPGAGGAAKRWPAHGFAAVTAATGATVVVHEGPADADAVRAYRACARQPALALVQPELPVLAGALAIAGAYIGNDSGVSHLAAAVGTPSIVLFTRPMLPWVPWSASARCLTVTTAELVDDDRAAVAEALEALP